MKVKRFVAEDMRTALRQIKEDMGPDAVILSNRKLGKQTEILVADNYDEAFLNQALDQALHNSSATVQASVSTVSRTNKPVPGNRASDFNVVPDKRSVNGMTNNEHILAKGKINAINAAKNHPADNLFPPPMMNTELSAMHEELKSLKAMIESQQVMSDWGKLSKEHPLRITLYKRLTELGISQDVCKYLVKGLDDKLDIEQGLQAALKKMMHLIPVIDDDILNRGGVYAMVGPTGVGKTTTIAKLAARFAMRHGQKHVALVSTDNYRIGAHEQLLTYGRLLGVPVHSASNAQELQQLLHKLYDKKLVLIDTAGMSQRDVRLTEQFAHVGRQHSLIKSYLVMSANAQLPTLNEVVRSFKKANLAGCILTKVDEAVSMGGVLSVLIRHHLAAAYVSNGQRVPEDLLPARSRDLVNDLLQHARNHREPSDDSFMAVAFSGGVGHAHL